jgi:hypothetical protein
MASGLREKSRGEKPKKRRAQEAVCEIRVSIQLETQSVL